MVYSFTKMSATNTLMFCQVTTERLNNLGEEEEDQLIELISQEIFIKRLNKLKFLSYL